MSEPITNQESITRPTLTLDQLHHFRGFWEDGGVCRLRIFEREDYPPVIVLSELKENENTSITNIIEHLAPEIVKQYLSHRLHESPPATFLEHYDAILNARRRRAGPSVARVSFSHFRPTIVNLGGIDRLSYGNPTWAQLDAGMLAAFIGQDVNLDDDA